MKKIKMIVKNDACKLKYEDEVIELRDEKIKLDTDTDDATNDNYDDESTIDNDIDTSDNDIDNDNEEFTEDEEIVDVDEPVDNDTKKAKKKDNKKGTSIFRIIKCLAIIIAVFGVLLGGYIVFQNHIGVVIAMNGDCMKPNIKNGETVVASRLVKAKDIKRNDVVVFEKKEGMYYMRRVIGLPGEKVEIKDGDVYINDKKIKDPYRGKKSMYGIIEKDSIKLGKDEFFVLCDHRPNIDDSRMNEMGLIKSKEIIAVKRAK